VDDRWAAKLEELREGAASQGVEWLRSALSRIFRDELRALAAAAGVQTRADDTWVAVAQLREELAKVLAPAREVGCVESGF